MATNARDVRPDGPPDAWADAVDRARGAIERMVADALARDPATAGLPPPGMIVRPEYDGAVTATHFGYESGGWRIETTVVQDAWDRRLPDMPKTAAVDRLVRLAHRLMRAEAAGSTEDARPSWTVLAHPVATMVLASHEPDRGLMPLDGAHGTATRRWTVDADRRIAHPGRCGVATGAGWIAEGRLEVRGMGVLMPAGAAVLAVSLTSVRADGTTLALPGRLPDTARTGIEGMALGGIVSLPRSGDDELDAACDAATIRSVRELANGFELTFAPTAFLPYGVAPTAELGRAMRLDPIVD